MQSAGGNESTVRPRYSIVDCVVTGHAYYGVLVRAIGSDESGYVDRADISDQALPESQWPAVGSTIR